MPYIDGAVGYRQAQPTETKPAESNGTETVQEPKKSWGKRIIEAVKSKKDFFKSLGASALPGATVVGAIVSPVTGVLTGGATGATLFSIYLPHCIMGVATAVLGVTAAASAVLSLPAIIGIAAGATVAGAGAFLCAIAEAPNQDQEMKGVLVGSVLSAALAYGAVSQTSLHEKAAEPEASNTTSQIENAKGSLKADFISRMTFDAEPAPQQRKLQAPALKL